jgi:hypothetical protein
MKIFLPKSTVFNTLFFLVIFFQTSLAQTIGDYRSVANGNWTTLSNWQYYNGSTWATPSGTSPQGYPGQFTGTGTVTIQNGNIITLNADITNSFTKLVIGNATTATASYFADFSIGGDFILKTLDITIDKYAILKFTDNKGSLYLPENAGILINAPGGLAVPGGPGNCNNNVNIFIGTIQFAVCTGGGANFTFTDLNSSGGTLYAKPSATSPISCGDSLELKGDAVSPSASVAVGYSWIITPPNGVPFTSNLKNPTPFIASTGTYTAKLTCSATYNTVNFSNAQTITIVVNAITAPIVGTITQPNCSVPTGSVVLSGLPSSGTWTLTRSGASSGTTTGTGTSTTISSLPTGTYNYTVTSANGCISGISTNVVINNAFKTWTGASNSDWNTAANWTPAGVPTSSTCIVIPDVTNDPIISGTNTNSFANTLTIQNGAKLVINGTNTLTVTDAVNVNTGGTFNIKDKASLVQINTVANTGIVNIERISQPMNANDYTYWNSPVTLSSGFTLGALSPGSSAIYSWIPTIANGAGNWKTESSTTIMNPTKGYIVRAPDTFSASAAEKVTYTANFIGTPNNGTVLMPISKGTYTSPEIDYKSDEWNLIGNPYPSAINASDFLNLAANVPVIDGTIYLWTHNTQPSTAIVDPFYGDFTSNYTSNDYAVFNTTGGTAIAPSGGTLPTGFIASGQSFFVKAASGAANNGTTANVTFTNEMRVTGNNSNFFKTSNARLSASTVVQKNRIWLNLTNDTTAFSQILVGYITGATQALDRNFDGKSLGGNGVGFYSIISEGNLTIQGRALPFDNEDKVDLGYYSRISGNLSIRIDHVDGLFEDQDIYIEDKLLNVIHDLKKEPYTFSTTTGTFNNRFVLIYTDADSNKTLATDDFTIAQNTVLVSVKNKQIKVNAGETIDKVVVYDLLGRQIYTKTAVNSNELVFSNIVSAQQTLLVKVVLQNGSSSTKKIVYY